MIMVKMVILSRRFEDFMPLENFNAIKIAAIMLKNVQYLNYVDQVFLPWVACPHMSWVKYAMKDCHICQLT